MDKKQGLLKLTLLLVSSLTIMSVITISPALPQMAVAFAGVPNADFLVKLILTLPAFTIAVFAPVTGRLIDRYGRLKILWFALVLYAVAGTAGFYLNNIYAILLSRALLGMAVGMSMPIVITLVADYFKDQERQKFAGLQIAFMSLGGIIFIGLGGVLADYGWRYPFMIYLSSLLVLPLSVLYLFEPVKAEKYANETPGPIRAPGIIWFLFLNTLFMWVIFFLIPVQIPFHLKALGVKQNALIGAAIAISTAFSAVSSLSYAKLKARLGSLSIFSLGYLLLALGFVCVSVSATYLMVATGMVLAGLGMGMMIPNTNIWVMQITPPAIRGKEIGKLTTSWFLGQFLSPVIMFPVLKYFSLATTFMLTGGLLFLISLGFILPKLIKAEKKVAGFPPG